MNKTALITGASKRIGKSIAEYLAGKGWNIIVHYNSSKKLADEFVRLLCSKYPNQNFYLVTANLNDMDEVVALIPNVISEFGEFQLLVNNASIFNAAYLKETSLELFNNQINVNLKAPFILIRDFANHCKSGNIINLVDTRVTTNKSNFAAYSISKKALWELTKMAALEFAPEIRVNAIAPGVTLPPNDKDDKYLLDLAENIPMKKPGGVKPILKSINYILNNNHLTGQLLFVDGGENLGQNA
ncbi:MAG: SDR family oxidoreductase [Bacteroidetes bacterium]|nr:SDR family oxidoreductase [Bacteroidota bacterium]